MWYHLSHCAVVFLDLQLEESERARVQLQDTLDCLGDNKVIAKEEINEREKELMSLVDATERAAVSHLILTNSSLSNDL